MPRPGIALWLLAAASAVAAPAPRQEVSLNGDWESRRVEELTAPPAGGTWTPCRVPGYLRGHDYERAWLRRSFAVPEAMKGQRIKLHFGGVKYNCRVLVNGKPIGGCFGGYQPFEVDVTDAIHFGKPNELAVGCHDWTGIFTPGERVNFQRDGWARVRGIPRDRVLAPIGGLYGLYGIWDDVTLRSHPAVYVKDLFIKTSVRRGELSVEYTLKNDSRDAVQVRLRAAVEQKGRDVLQLMPSTVDIPAGKTAKITISQRWPKPHLWSHVDPHLYHLRTELSSGDVLRTRFGFREFWVEGHRFYLNGVPINLLATSWWPPHAPMTREQVRERWEAVKKCGCVAFRTHTQPWRTVHYDVADEIGLLMIPEGAIWNDDGVYRVNDPTFWGNYARHLMAMVDRDKNRPSVVMWSLENELTGGRINDSTPGPKAQLVRMGRLVKQRDPTRPIFYESDGDPGGVADVIGIHYPHEYPNYTCWPNEAYWLDKPSPGTGGGGIFLNGAEQFLWRKRKPLYVGEFLWLPSSNPSWHTVFFGDEAYTDYRRYRNLGKAESWKMQILGYRHHEVGGISPWTVIEGGPLDETNPLYQAHQYAYQHIAAFCHDHDRRFYGGEKVRRRVEIFNDVMTASKLTFTWDVSIANKIGGGQRLTLGPAEHRMLDVVVPMVEVDRRRVCDWSLRLHREGKKVFADTHRCFIFPKPRLSPQAARIGLLDPKGTTRKLFEAYGLKTQAVESLARLAPKLEVLVVGAGAFAARERAAPVIGRIAPERSSLLSFVARGGRVLVLEQAAYPEGLFDVGLTKQKSTMTFPLRPSHPALRGVERDDLKFWRGDHLVAADEPPRPATGGYRAIVVSGSRAGLANAPLLERAIGRGTIVFSQLKLVEKFASEPTAAQILDNLLAYLAAYQAKPRATAVLGGSPAYRGYLRGLGLRFRELTGEADAASLSSCSLVICRGALRRVEALRRYVEAGGNLLLHRTPASESGTLRRAFGIDLALHPYGGHVARAEGKHALLEAIAREDLYWLGKHVGIGWSTTPMATGVADAAFGKTLEGRQTTTHEAEDWKLEGQIVERRAPGVTFATVGSVTGEIEFPAAGQYIVGLVARGTPCDGVYPVALIKVDGERFGSVGVAGETWRTYTAFGPVAKGRHKLSVAFVNDGSNPPKEDRNLYLDKILVARDDKPGGVAFLTSPPTVAVVRLGKGTVVIDEMRWDTEARNARKAARYASSLLGELGADFAPRSGVALECEAMAPQPGMKHFRATGATASLACSGYVGTKVDIAAAGRYAMELVAGGTEAEGVFPHVKVTLDDRAIGEVQLTSGGLRAYELAVELPAGTHELRVHFTNDFNVPGVSDRNLVLDRVVFYREQRKVLP